MAKLSIKLNLLPGIERNIDLTLKDLLEAFNSSWSLEDRLELVMGLNLDKSGRDSTVSTLAKVIGGLDVGKLTVDQLVILDSAIKDFKSKIEAKKEELKKD